jgi:rubredoxin
MIIGTEYQKTLHYRKSKLGVSHSYYRNKTILVFRCDNCGEIFRRDRGEMSPKRATNNFYHICSDCNVKKFAQEKSIEKKHIWDMPVSSLKTLGQL